MKLDLLKYMSERINEDEDSFNSSGPVITISRLHGCPAKTIAKKLRDLLNEKTLAKNLGEAKWQYVTKEILYESAKELDLEPSRIKYVFDYKQKSMIDELLSAHSNKYYKSDRKIRNTVAMVVRNMANEGHAIIVGRGGVAITRDIPRSLHINLEAPLDWRIVRMAEKLDLSLEQAERTVKDTDKKRKQFRDYFQGKNTDYTSFDMSFNCMTLSVNEIANIILKAIEERNLLA